MAQYRKIETATSMARGLPGSQGIDAAQEPLRERADQTTTRLRGDEQGVRAGYLLRQRDRAVADRRSSISRRVSATQLDQCRTGRPPGLDAAGGARRAGRRP